MMRSLYSGVAGLRTHQIKMDVIGNNIANVNTVGYKSTSVTFQDLMYQTTQSATGANAATGRGGMNAKQIGLGVTTGAFKNSITSAGAPQTTNNPFDLRITGDSFFIVNDGSTNFYTKAGNFDIDASGNLVMSSTGYNVMGWQVDDATGDIVKTAVSPLKILANKNLTLEPEATTKAQYKGIVDDEDEDVNNAAGKATIFEFYDALGFSYDANFTTHNVKGMSPGPAPYDPATALPEGSFYITLDDILDGDENSVMASSGATFGNTLEFTDSAGVTTTVNNAILVTYDPDDHGKLTAIDGVANATLENLTFGTGAGQLRYSPITIDFSGSYMASNDGKMTTKMEKGDENKDGLGRALGTMTGVTIDTNGKIYGSYDSGPTKLLGQIAVTEFANAAGLSKEGDNLYAETLNSGEFDGIGQDVTADGGKLSAGVLEMSNVDLSSEFTEMITTQRGFQANSRIITVSDTMIEELVNLKRS